MERLISDIHPHIDIFVSAVLGGFVFAFIIVSTLFYYFRREKEYRYFTLFILSIVLARTIYSENFITYFNEGSMLLLSLQIFIVQLYYFTFIQFTLYLLDIDKIDSKVIILSQKLIVAILLISLLSFLGFEYIIYVTTLIVYLFLIYIAKKAYIMNPKIVSYYLVVTIGYFISIGMLFSPYLFDNRDIVGMMMLTCLFTSLMIAGHFLIILYKTNNFEKTPMMLMWQSRLASLGETVGNIAHQWKQPLNAVGTIQNNIKATLEIKGEIPKRELLGFVNNSFDIIKHLANTIDTFYGFLKFNESTERESFYLSDKLKSIQPLTEYSLFNAGIQFDTYWDVNPLIHGNPNELLHAVLNIVLNAKDALDNQSIQHPRITLYVIQNWQNATIKICDNGGGITLKPIERVFEYYVTTKAGSTGIGLFMAKNIIESRFGGEIRAENSDEGACFTITLSIGTIIHEQPSLALSSHKTFAQIKTMSQHILQLEQMQKELKPWVNTFNQVEWGMVLFNAKDSKISLVNSAFCKLHGYDEIELVGQNFFSLMDNRYVTKLGDNIITTLANGYTHDEYMSSRKDGRTFYSSIDLNKVIDYDTSSVFIIGIVRNINKQKITDELLKLKRYALNNIRQAVFLNDENANFSYVNDEACRSLGYTKEELLELNLRDIDPSFDEGLDHKELLESLKVVQKSTIRSRHKRKDGVVFPVEIVANYIDYLGKEYVLTFVENITEKIKTEKELELLVNALDNAGEAIYIANGERRITYMNSAANEMLGYDNEELIGRSIAYIVGDMSEEDIIKIRENILNGGVTQFIGKHIHKDGHLIDVEVSIRYFKYENELIGVSSARDITEKLASERDLKKSLNIYNTLVNHQSDYISRLDLEGKHIFVNKAITDVYGAPPSFFIGKTVLETDQHPRNVDLHQKILDAVATKEPQSIQLWYPTPDGNPFVIESRLIPEIDERGDVVSVLGIARDISQFIHVQQELVWSKKVYEEIFENMFDATYLIEVVGYKQFKNLAVNKAFEALTGMGREMLVGKMQHDTVDKATTDLVAEKYQKCVDTKEPIRGMVELELPTGKKIYESILIPVFNQQKEVYRIVGITRIKNEGEKNADN